MNSDPTPRPRYARVSIVCVRDGRLLGFFGEDPVTAQRLFFLPGGKPEPDESMAEAGRRETLEETGHSVRPRPETERIVDYEIIWGGQPWPCTTHFFLAEHEADPSAELVLDDASYHRGVAWIPVTHLDEHLGFSPEILDAVRSLLA